MDVNQVLLWLSIILGLIASYKVESYTTAGALNDVAVNNMAVFA